MIQVVNLLVDYPLVKLWDIKLLSIFGGNIDKSSARRS